MHVLYISRSIVSDLHQIEEDVEKRIRSDEGICVGNPAQMSNKNWNRLYWRLLKQNANYWFGMDGKILSYPDPCRKEPLQLFREDQTWFDDENIQENFLRFISVSL